MARRPSYTKKMDTIRKYVDFDFKRPERLGRGNKVKLTKYYNFLLENSDKYRAIKPPARGDFEAVQEDVNPTFTRIPKRIRETEFKVLFLPLNKLSATVKYNRKRRKWAVVEETPAGTTQEFVILFKDKDALVADPKAYVDALVAGYPKDALFRLFNPQGWQSQTAYDKEGRMVSQGGMDKGLIGGEVLRLSTLYPKETEDFMMGLSVTIQERSMDADNLALIGEAEYRERQEKKGNNN